MMIVPIFLMFLPYTFHLYDKVYFEKPALKIHSDTGQSTTNIIM